MLYMIVSLDKVSCNGVSYDVKPGCLLQSLYQIKLSKVVKFIIGERGISPTVFPHSTHILYKQHTLPPLLLLWGKFMWKFQFVNNWYCERNDGLRVRIPEVDAAHSSPVTEEHVWSYSIAQLYHASHYSVEIEGKWVASTAAPRLTLFCRNRGTVGS